MTHEEIKNSLNDYFDERLSTEANVEIELHISECMECSQYLFSLQDLMKNAENLPQKVKPESDFWEEIFGIISSIKNKSIKEQEKIESKEAEKLWEEIKEEEQEKKKKRKKEKSIVKDQKRAEYFEKLKKPIYLYILLGIIGLFAAYYAYNKFFVGGADWTVSKRQFSAGTFEYFKNLKNNEFVETGNNDWLEVSVPNIGSVILEPNTQIQRLSFNSFKLIKGEITAQKNGAEDLLSVYVPGAAIKDFFLGGNYKLNLSGTTNDSKLTVNEGWISIQKDEIESLVIENHVCEVKPDSGIGVPYNFSASADLLDLLGTYSFSKQYDEATLISLLSKVSTSDAVTLLNILPRTTIKQREIVMFTMFNLVGQPYEVTDEKLRMLKKDALVSYMEYIETKI